MFSLHLKPAVHQHHRASEARRVLCSLALVKLVVLVLVLTTPMGLDLPHVAHVRVGVLLGQRVREVVHHSEASLKEALRVQLDGGLPGHAGKRV